jgi:hypothetical protein
LPGLQSAEKEGKRLVKKISLEKLGKMNVTVGFSNR